MPVNFAKKSSPVNFKAALNKLSTDAAFRADVEKHPEKLTTTFALSLTELHALRQAAQLSGANMSAINKVRASELTRISTVGGAVADVGDINVSCCCCCCCGETSVARSYA